MAGVEISDIDVIFIPVKGEHEILFADRPSKD
jgi:hypothetical protein